MPPNWAQSLPWVSSAAGMLTVTAEKKIAPAIHSKALMGWVERTWRTIRK